MQAITLSLILGAVVSLSSAQFTVSILDLVASPFRSIEAAPYTVQRTFENGIEERIYPAKKWATVEKVVTEKSMDNIRRDMFMTLFGYITGKNENNQKIAMTVPVATKVEEVEGGKTSYQMGFFVPEEFQSSPPAPTDPNVKIVERNPHVYSITFGGYADESDYQSNWDTLKTFVRTQNLTMSPVTYYSGYDSPMKFWNRRNEVWISV